MFNFRSFRERLICVDDAPVALSFAFIATTFRKDSVFFFFLTVITKHEFTMDAQARALGQTTWKTYARVTLNAFFVV